MTGSLFLVCELLYLKRTHMHSCAHRHPSLFETIYSIFICTCIVHHLGLLFELRNVMHCISIHISTVLFYKTVCACVCVCVRKRAAFEPGEIVIY
jgi:hypothetical protein